MTTEPTPGHPYRDADPRLMLEMIKTLPADVTSEEFLRQIRIIRYVLNTGAFEGIWRRDIAAAALVFDTLRDNLNVSAARDQDRYAWVVGISFPATLAAFSRLPWPSGLVAVALFAGVLLWALEGMRTVRLRLIAAEQVSNCAKDLAKLAQEKPIDERIRAAGMDGIEEVSKAVNAEVARQNSLPEGQSR